MIEVKNPYEVRVKSFRKRRKFIAVDKPLEVVDKETGEVTTATPLLGNSSYRDTSPFVKLYDPTVLFILKGYESKVFAYILEVMDYSGSFVLDVDVCSRSAGINSRTVYKALDSLVKYDVIKRNVRSKYWVNPNIACKGSRDGMNLVFEDETTSGLQ